MLPSSENQTRDFAQHTLWKMDEEIEEPQIKVWAEAEVHPGDRKM